MVRVHYKELLSFTSPKWSYEAVYRLLYPQQDGSGQQTHRQ